VSLLRGFLAVALVVSAFVLIGVWLDTESRIHAQSNLSTTLLGAWTLNEGASDHQGQPSKDQDKDDEGRRRGGDGFGRGRFGGGFGGPRSGGGGGNFDPEQVARLREAMRELMNPPKHLTIVQNGSMVILTGPDGRTTRLATDGKKVKDESTQIERRTKWEDERLVSEISGVGGGKVTETYWVDSEHHQLHRDLFGENTRRPVSTSHVYDADAR
jgi:hypothetical protein